MGIPGRERNRGKVGNSSWGGEPGQEARKLTWPCYLGWEGPQQDLGHMVTRGPQRADWQVGSRHRDSVMSCFPRMTQWCPWAVNSELCAAASRPPCLCALQACRVSLLPCPLLPSLPQGPMITASRLPLQAVTHMLPLSCLSNLHTGRPNCQRHLDFITAPDSSWLSDLG